MGCPTVKDKIDDKFLGIKGLMERAKKLIDRGFYQKAKECLDLAAKCADSGRKLNDGHER